MIPLKSMLVESYVLRRFMHFLFRWKGLRALGHFLRRRLYADRWVLIEDFDGDLRFYCHLNEHIGSFMYWRGAYSWNQLRVLAPILKDGMVFVDAGANQGELTLFVAKRLPHGRVVAFEPITEMFQRLQRNLEVNGFDNAILSNSGLWSEPTTREIYWRGSAAPDGSFNEGLGTLFPTAECAAVVQEIQCATLDAFLGDHGIQRVDIMKLDVEGAELHVLQGAKDTIERCRPTVLLEVDRSNCRAAGVEPDALLDFLRRWYRFEVILPSGRTRPLQRRSQLREHQDLLCLPQ